MSYSYAQERPFVFTEDGQVNFLAIRDEANRLCNLAGAVDVIHLMKVGTVDTFQTLACIDRWVDLKEFRWANQDYATQRHILQRIERNA